MQNDSHLKRFSRIVTSPPLTALRQNSTAELKKYLIRKHRGKLKHPRRICHHWERYPELRQASLQIPPDVESYNATLTWPSPISMSIGTSPIIAFKQWLENTTKLGTVIKYVADVRGFYDYLQRTGCRISVDVVDSNLILEWLRDMKERGNIDRTRKCRLQGVSRFFHYLFAIAKVIQRNPCTKDEGIELKVPRKEMPNPLPLEMALAFLEFIPPSGYMAWITRITIATQICTGCRIGEVLSAKANCLVVESPLKSYLKISDPKNREDRICFLPKDLTRVLVQHREKIKYLESPWLFPSPYKGGLKHINTATVQSEFRKLWLLFSPDVYHRTHDCRAYFVTTLLNAGVRDQVVMRLVGQKSHDALRPYHKIATEDLRRAQEQHHPLYGRT
jgi:integrase/recombinase XerC